MNPRVLMACVASMVAGAATMPATAAPARPTPGRRPANGARIVRPVR